MCGITGLAGEASEEAARQKIFAMTAAVAHRGPDADGFFVNRDIALGHRRLSIIDLSVTANQPMSDSSGRYTIVFNGEIYNFAELKAGLSTYDFQTDSDTEVLLALFIARGANCLSELNGMFAFAVWDAQEKSLFVARDRLGEKPLYYFHDGGKFIFASELRALLASGAVPRKLDREAINQYLRFYSIAAPLTPLKNVRMLMPGNYGIFRNKSFSTHSYWSLVNHSDQQRAEDYPAAVKKVRELLEAAIERRLVSDVPLGAFLSGGIDSSAIVALMSSVTTQPVSTFSIVFEEKKYDESVYSELIARKYRTRHHAVQLSSRDFLAALPDALQAMDCPTVDGVNTFVVSGATRRAGCAVALSGLGGDELFAGYSVFQQYQKIKRLKSYYQLPQAVKSFAGRALSQLKKDHKSERRETLLALKNTNFENLYPIFRRSYSRAEIARLTNNQRVNGHPLKQFFSSDELKAIDKLPIFSQVSIGELSTYTLNQLLRDTDQMSMAHALEVRVPFLDYKLVEYVLSLPDAYKQPVYPKKLLVDALGELLPREIVYRPKMGFTFPWETWLRGDLKDFCQAKMQNLKAEDIFDSEALESIWDGFLQNSPQITWVKVWLLVVLADWMERNGING